MEAQRHKKLIKADLFSEKSQEMSGGGREQHFEQLTIRLNEAQQGCVLFL